MGRDGCEVRLGVTPVSDGVHRRVMSRVCPGSPRYLFTGTGTVRYRTGTVPALYGTGVFLPVQYDTGTVLYCTGTSRARRCPRISDPHVAQILGNLCCAGRTRA